MIITEKILLTALWEAYYHMELENLGDIDGNDHPRLLKLRDDLWRRLSYEQPIDEETGDAKL